MTEQTQRLKKALRGCAERGISPTIEPWAEIQVRLEARTATPARRPRWLPRTRAGLVLATALVLVFGMGAYGASGLVYEMFRGELPGAEEPVYGEQLDLQQTANGVRVSLEWAYADSENVVVGYKIKDLEGDRQIAGRPAELGANALEEGGGSERHLDERFPNRVELADTSSTDFDSIGGGSMGSGNLEPSADIPISGVFAPEKAVEPGAKHKFRLRIPVVAQALPSMNPSEPVGEPFVFDFEIPVRPAPTVEVEQKVEANGVALTLERVVNSPARPQAVFCLDPPIDDHYWFPLDDDPLEGGLVFEGGPVAGEGYCAEVLLGDRLEGSSSLTVTELEGMPRDPDSHDYKKIPGPWTFEFGMPETPR